jgi:hypothetical protein
MSIERPAALSRAPASSDSPRIAPRVLAARRSWVDAVDWSEDVEGGQRTVALSVTAGVVGLTIATIEGRSLRY